MTRFHYRLLLVLLLTAILPAPSISGEVLRVLAWPGYADPDIVKVFEQRTHSKVEVTTVDSDDILWQRVSQNNAGNFDVLAVNTAELQRYIHQGWILPINTTALPNIARQLPRFRDVNAIPGIVHDGKVFAIPYTYAEMGLIYDRQQIKEAPDSITALWDPRYRGKVLVFNDGTHNFSLAAQSLGMSSPFRLGDRDWPVVVNRLIALRRNALTFYAEPEESVELFKRKRAVLMLANYGSQQLQLMKAAGIDVAYVLPKEGALAWLDTWAITRGARNKALAEAWINYLLEKEPGEVLRTRQGLSNTTSPSLNHASDDNLIWLETVENVERRNSLWKRIISGDRASRVLEP